MRLMNIWNRLLSGTELLDSRPDFRFDPAFYATRNPEVVSSGMDLRHHFEAHGRAEGRHATAYQALRAQAPACDLQLRTLVTDQDLAEALADSVDGALELAYELIALGDPIDRMVSDFSADHYFALYPEVLESGMSGIFHYLAHGFSEGRTCLRDVRRNQFEGQVDFDPAKPSCLVCVHELSQTGSPMVALDLVRAAARSHNVFVAASRRGVLLPKFRENACRVVVTESPEMELGFFDLPDLETLDFGLLNSVEAGVFARALVRHSVPFAGYIHEFVETTFPQAKCRQFALLSDVLLFSSETLRHNWSDTLSDIGFDPERDSLVVPQSPVRRNPLSRDSYETARARLSRLLGTECQDRRIVYGAGYAHWRKGTDLFVLTAQIARAQGSDAMFVWIGEGRNPEDFNFGLWLETHLEQLDVNAADGNLFFLPSGPEYRDLVDAADVLYLPSRRDPLPNVVFDAVEAGAQCVMFETATGFDDPVYQEQNSIVRVPFGDVLAASEAVLHGPRKTVGRGTFASQQEAVPDRGSYAASMLSRICEALRRHQAHVPRPVSDPGTVDVPTMVCRSDGSGEQDALHDCERAKIWAMGRRFLWRSEAEVQGEITASDNWVYEDTRLERFAWVTPDAGPAFQVHFHATCMDRLAEDLSGFALLPRAERIVVSTGTTAMADAVRAIAQQASLTVDLRILDPRDGDTRAFLDLFQSVEIGEEEIWCHLHQNWRLTRPGDPMGIPGLGQSLHGFLMSNLLGDGRRASNALEIMNDPRTGLVCALDPCRFNWMGARALRAEIEGNLPAALPEQLLLFPVGNMFWTKGKVARAMTDLFAQDHRWPRDPILPDGTPCKRRDGTVYHLIERLWPALAASVGMSAVFLNNPEQERRWT